MILKKKMTNESKCLICDGSMELISAFDTKFGKAFLCKNCAKKLYRAIGEKLIPQSPTNLFQNKK